MKDKIVEESEQAQSFAIFTGDYEPSEDEVIEYMAENHKYLIDRVGDIEILWEPKANPRMIEKQKEMYGKDYHVLLEGGYYVTMIFLK